MNGPQSSTQVVAGPAVREMWDHYVRLLKKFLGSPESRQSVVPLCWLYITGEALEAFPDRLERETAETLVGDVIECLDAVVERLPVGSALATDCAAPLLVQMALLAVSRWLHVKADLSRWTCEGLPTLPLLEDTVAALVAASCLGLNVNLRLRIDSQGQPQLDIANLVSDREELQVGRIDAIAATARALLARALPSTLGTDGRIEAVPTDAFVADQVNRHARRTGARLMVSLPGEEADLARHARSRWNAGAYVREPLQGNRETGEAHPLLALQEDIKTHLQVVRAALRVVPGQAHQPSATPASQSRPMVFISYAHKDRGIRDEFQRYLNTYVVHGSLTVWTDDLIGAGDQWEAKIRAGIESCKVAVFLLTHDFLGSTFIMDTELPQLGNRYDRGEIRIVPILMGPCDVRIIDWLQQRQVVPSIDTVVPDGSGNDRREHLFKFAKTVHDYAHGKAGA